jgi:hypothetical protein
MAIKVVVQDSVSDLFQVEFKDDFAVPLSQYVKSEETFNASMEVTGSRYVMPHTALIEITNQMALN